MKKMQGLIKSQVILVLLMVLVSCGKNLTIPNKEQAAKTQTFPEGQSPKPGNEASRKVYSDKLTDVKVTGDKLIEVLYQPFEVKISDKFVTPKVKEKIIARYKNRYLRSGMPYYSASEFGKSYISPMLDLTGEKWVKVIPLAPMTTYSGKCPLCKKSFKGVTPNLDEKFTAKTKCCKKTLYSRKEDIPSDYPIKLDKKLILPCMDGKTRTFNYLAVEMQDFFPAGIISGQIQKELLFNVIPHLELMILLNNDPKAINKLSWIMDREADIYAALPWGKCGSLEFAKYQDIPSMLPPNLKDLATKFKGKSEDFISSADYDLLNRELLNGEIGHIAGSVQPNIMVLGRRFRTTRQGTLAEAWDIIKDSNEEKELSKKKYGDETTLSKHMLAMLRKQAAYVRHNHFDVGNFVISVFAGAVPLAVVTKDQAMAENIVEKIFTHLYNHFYPEGISHEGAFNYSHMMSAPFEPLVVKEAFGVDFTKRFPWVNTIYKNWDYPIVTLLNIESTHGDAHAAFFASRKLPPAEKVEYSKHEKSQVFPEYGITCLRAGNPGSRLEVIMSHQNTIMHTDPDRLAIQLFYEGVNLLPDIGYMTSGSKIAKAKKEILKSEFKIIPEPLKKKYDYNDAAEAHCNALINGFQPGLQCATFERFQGGQGINDPAYLSQFIQADGAPVYFKHIDPVDIYNRQLLTVNFSNGRPVVFDVFRLKGGRRHDFFWHVPAKQPESNLGPPLPLKGKNLHEFFSNNAEPKPGWRKEEDHFSRFYDNKKWPYKDDILKKLTDPVIWSPKKNQVWNFTWYINPDRYLPHTAAENKEWEKWSKFQQPVQLRIWGIPDSANNIDEKILGALGPWGADLPGFGGLQYDKALSYLIEHRQGTKDLASTFVHVLEPYTEKQGPNLKQVTRIVNDNPSADGRAVKIESENGEIAYVATTLNDNKFNSSDIKMEGRAGVIFPQSKNLSLYDGTSLESHGVSLKLAETMNLKLVGLHGDLSGNPTESALLVESAAPIPTNGILNGHTITVIHQTGKAHTMGYQIEKVTQMDNNIYKIDLIGTPRFTQYRLRVAKYDKEKPLEIETDRENIVGNNRPYLIGRKIYFPRSEFRTTITGTTAGGWRAYYNREWFLKDTPAPEAIKVGDPVIIYAIQEGDRVLIPSFFACKASPDKSSLLIQSSGDAVLKLPGKLELSSQHPGVTISYDHDATKLQIKSGTHKLSLR